MALNHEPVPEVRVPLQTKIKRIIPKGIIRFMVPVVGLEPIRISPHDFESRSSAIPTHRHLLYYYIRKI